MARWSHLGLLAVLGTGVDGLAQTGEEIDYPALLRRMVHADWLWRAPRAGERCVQFSSYDRRSHSGSGTDDWYANDDRGNFLRVDEREGQREFVMVDATGPGCVARIWSANPSGTLFFDVDGKRVWSVDFAALCSGRVAGVPEPLAGMRSRGGNCYLPVPFAERLVVSCTGGDLYYLVDIAQFTAGTRVPSFTPDLVAGHAELLRDLGGVWDRYRHWSAERETQWEVPPGSLVRRLSVAVAGAADADAGRILGRVLLEVRCGIEVTVNVPLLDFFAAGRDLRPWRSFQLDVEQHDFERKGSCHWPMPMPDGGTVSLVTEGDLDGASVALDVAVEPLAIDPGQQPLLFRASYHQQYGTPTRPFTDHLVLDAKGTGRFVGCSLLVRNPSRLWWGEGDEKVQVDGEAFPSWWGTGTEDYFGYAWCDPTPFQAPFHAQIECQGPQNFGFTQLHRTQLLDSIPFQKSLRFEFERWHWVETARMDYATVAYWYGAPGATSGLPPVPPADERHLARLEQPPIWIAEGVLEAEDLRVVARTGGEEHAQDMGQFERAFSRDGIRWWRDGKPGDTLVLSVPVATAGRYRVSAAFGQAQESGRVQVSFGGGALGEPFDGYATGRRPSGPVVLGEVELTAGEHELRLELLEPNAAAQAGNHVGLDYLRLESLP